MSKSFKWMPILRTGKFTDKNNQEVAIAEADLDKIISSTDLAKEPQFVIEHPKEDSIGFGTISSLKRVGEFLFALPKEVNDKFKTAVNGGKLPGRSVTLDANSFALKNISFLSPSVEPAVSGLGEYSFSGEDKIDVTYTVSLPGEKSTFAEIENDNIEFSHLEVSRGPFQAVQVMLRNVKNFFIGKFDLETADKLFPEYYLNDLGNPLRVFKVEDEPYYNSFSQNQTGDKMKVDLSKIEFSKLDPAIRAAFEALQTENTTLQTSLTTKDVELQAANTKLTTAEKVQLRNEVLQFCAGDDVKLKIKPADKEKVINLLMSLKEKGTIEFSATDNSKVRFDPFEFTKEIIKNSGDVIELSEIATNDNSNVESMTGYQKTAKEMAEFVNR